MDERKVGVTSEVAGRETESPQGSARNGCLLGIGRATTLESFDNRNDLF